MRFNELLQEYIPSGDFSTDQVSRVAESHLSEILGRISTLPALPHSTELEGLVTHQPILIERPVTANDLTNHLEGAAENTPEIGLFVFGSGENVLYTGTEDGVLPDIAWSPFARHAEVDLHTHPNPTDALLMRQPSQMDLDLPHADHGVVLIGSRDGITLVPSFKDDEPAHQTWIRYVTETRGLDRTSYDAYGGDVVYKEFLEEVVKPVFVPWDQLEPNMSIAGIARHLAGQ